MANNDAKLAVRALALLDLTDLSDHSDEAGTEALCARAMAAPGPVAAICIWPRFVATARAVLGTSPVKIATVVNFPAGGTDTETVIAEIEDALAAGADEIDFVFPWRTFLSARSSKPAGTLIAHVAMLAAVRKACGSKTLKAILETGEYPDLDAVREASELAIAAGADFIKTSTGKTAHSASLPAARTMLEVIAGADRPVGLKPSGGIRNLADAAGYLALADEIMGPDWARPGTFRFGASGLHQVLVDTLAGNAAKQASGPY